MDDARRCPHCKELRKTTKQLSLSRLPPILVIHLKRFSFEGRWTDKIDTFVDFPMKGLDLTNYMPPPLPPGVDKGPILAANSISPEDPRSQLPPYRYDLYAVTNHFGSLSSGHCESDGVVILSSTTKLPTDTAFVSSRGGWLYCDDSSVKPADAREVVVSYSLCGLLGAHCLAEQASIHAILQEN
jgi:ubiquitin carboxyl-terminal hydrolase 8